MMDEIKKWFHHRRYSKISERYPDPHVCPDFYKANKQEYILRPGEMIFIPTGMFHFVFSEDPDPETGLCAAINFWYEHSHGSGNDEGDHNEKAQFGWHDIHLKFDEILQIIKGKEMRLNESNTICFPPKFIIDSFPGIDIKETKTTFEKFYKDKNPKQYIAQYADKELDKFAIPYKNKLNDSSVWINWGYCYTLPHYDGQDNWLCQIKGTRRIILIPQNERDLLYILNPYPVSLLRKIFDATNNSIDIKVSCPTLENSNVAVKALTNCIVTLPNGFGNGN